MGWAMSPEEVLADRFRRALYVHLTEGRDLDHEDEDRAVSASLSHLGRTMAEFLGGKVNLATLKYRMDNAFVETGCSFPPREVVDAMREVVLNIDVDEISGLLRELSNMPEDLPDAKGRLLDAEEFIARQASRGTVERSLADEFLALMLFLWHLQAPGMWPMRHGPLMRRLQDEGLVGRGDPPQDLVDHIMAVRRLEELTGAGRYDLGRLLPLLDDELPPEEECVQGCIGRIKALVEAGSWDLALRWSDLLMAFRPRSADALYGRIAAYEGKGLHMMATAEAETLVELLPEDLTAHRRLLALYKEKRMVPDYNREVRRFKAIMDARRGA
ncbi:hypothetical protein AOA80_04970 [Methanomassiliicoccales archaeon RumEn M1]|jgi:hypothetical protein|nr:hypothetical protein AOA80_04970 [Methanomassiliicoccales archaeon RumEn M1]